MENPEEKPRVCDSCYLVFDPDEFEGHNCEEKKPFICQICYLTFKEEEEMNQHIVSQHQADENEMVTDEDEMTEDLNVELDHPEGNDAEDRKPFRCSLCFLLFTDEESLKVHREKHDLEKLDCSSGETVKNYKLSTSGGNMSGNRKSHACHICSKFFVSKYKLHTHVRRHTGEGLHKCDQCDKSFTSKSCLLSHTWRMHNNFECTICKQVFETKTNLTHHMEIHRGKNMYHSCPKCKLVFNKKTGLNKHLRICERKLLDEKRYHSCSKCDLVFNQKLNLEKHLSICKGKITYMCTPCQKGFRSKIEYDQHIKSHERENAIFPCPHCSKYFFFKRIHLEEHIKTSHEGRTGECPTHQKIKKEIAHVCPKCKKEFVQKFELEAHLLAHDQKTYQCKLCDKSFQMALEFNEHMGEHRRNTDKEKKASESDMKIAAQSLNCTECKMIFFRADSLAKHMLTHNDEKNQCDECGKLFKAKTALHMHKIYDHTGEKPTHQCSECNESFAHASFLEDHVKKRHTEEPPSYPCEYCGKSFDIKNSMQKHVLCTHGENELQCNQCGKSFKCKAYLRQHMRTHELGNETFYQCGICDRGFLHKGNFTMHMRHMHDTENPHKCSYCNNYYTCQSDTTEHQQLVHSNEMLKEKVDTPKQLADSDDILKADESAQVQLQLSEEPSDANHTSVQNSEEIHQCIECQQTFKNEMLLREHSLTHSNEHFFQSDKETSNEMSYIGIYRENEEESFSCDICHKTYRFKSNLNRHMRKHRAKPYQCVHCDKLFATEAQLEEHSVTHVYSKERPHVCEECKRAYTTKDQLKRHMIAHSDEKPFQCDQCDKTFTSRLGLKYHTQGHNGERAFQCEQCDKAFIRKQDLTKHIQTHEDQRVFECDHCEKIFTRKSNYTAHVRTHSEDAPRYHCDECDRTFSTANSLQQHKVFRHSGGERLWKCEQCNMSFAYKAILARHIRMHHPEQCTTSPTI